MSFEGGCPKVAVRLVIVGYDLEFGSAAALTDQQRRCRAAHVHPLFLLTCARSFSLILLGGGGEHVSSASLLTFPRSLSYNARGSGVVHSLVTATEVTRAGREWPRLRSTHCPVLARRRRVGAYCADGAGRGSLSGRGLSGGPGHSVWGVRRSPGVSRAWHGWARSRAATHKKAARHGPLDERHVRMGAR